MNLDTFLTFCLSLPATEETLPFGPDILVLKVGGKMFAATGLEDEAFSVNLKCDPQRAVELRERYPDAILPGYHMNKKHWNTVHPTRADLPDAFVEDLIRDSYRLVVASLPGKLRDELGLA